MAMVDVLAHAREKALNEKNPHLMTIATLTGHALVAMGPYTAVMDNGAARKEQFAQKIFATGEKYGDPFEGIDTKQYLELVFETTLLLLLSCKKQKTNYLFSFQFPTCDVKTTK